MDYSLEASWRFLRMFWYIRRVMQECTPIGLQATDYHNGSSPDFRIGHCHRNQRGGNIALPAEQKKEENATLGAAVFARFVLLVLRK